jgi:hypothetical protein
MFGAQKATAPKNIATVWKLGNRVRADAIVSRGCTAGQRLFYKAQNAITRLIHDGEILENST